MAEVSLKAQVSNLLTEYSNLVRNYFAATEALAEGRPPPVLPAGGGPVHPDAIMQRIVDIDAKLQKAVDQIEDHQTLQRKIFEVQEDIRRHNANILALVSRLQEARGMLELCLDSVKQESVAMKQAKDSTVTFTEIISYAAKLSKYTSAPPNFDPANREITFEKPYPDEDRMRQGLLYRQYQTVPEQGDVFGEWIFRVLISSQLLLYEQYAKDLTFPLCI
ncbi:vitamin-D-receptor interacting mediator subunit 4-domain-containing protein [Endogone sp. FLAS-F59071]|nr:vitamin-D-receptor interacting mediator subunit 4-domain-containing protein [Endogone sp. FLAS-F59071]|eukprot:RUS15856.1 vitamin-D-receptor interacting mediator subunit 4-domain-containing protein [Endogone sp. FLAS-F59071]